LEKKIFSVNRFRLLILSLVLSAIIGIAYYVSLNGAQETETTPSPQPSQSASSISPTPTISEETQQQSLSLYDQGLKLYYDRQFDSALTLFNEALSLNPDSYQALNGKGATYAFLGRYDEGIDLINQALVLKPDFVYGHFNLGLANELAGRWDTAITAYHSAIDLDSKDVWSYYGIASIYGRQGNVDQTVAYLQQAIALQPDVRDVAKDEKDFNPVKNDPRFQALFAEQSSLKTTTNVPILYYHSIMVESGNELRMPPEEFAGQMNYLSQNGYHVLTLDQLYNAFYNKASLPAKPIVITFDDGYRDNFTNAFPIMQKYNFPGTVFMVSSYIDGDGFLTTDQLKQLQTAGWTIGGHTENHIDLSQVSNETAVQELKNSRSTLENLLGQPLKYMAYPFGGYNSSIMNLTQADGYVAGFTTVRGWASQETNPYAIQRIYCYANMGIQEFERRITHPDY